MVQSRLCARSDDDGSPVDWWFIYKLPAGVGQPKTEGYEYLYCDAHSDALTLSTKDLHTATDDSALEATLGAIFAPTTGTASWILYNDEVPVGHHNLGSKGHCKGVIAFDRASDSGVLLIHSTPRFPARDSLELPARERLFGQTYLCLTLADFATANAVAEQLRLQQDPQVYDHELGADIDADASVARLANGDNEPVPTSPSTIDIHTRGGVPIRLIAKNRDWGGDFWIDLVGPRLRVDMKVESWRRGTVPPTDEARDPDHIDDAQYIDLSPLGYTGFSWHYTKDHAKWGVSEQKLQPWVCVGDINRMVSQEKRGGGTAAFLDPRLWRALNTIELLRLVI